MTEKEIEKFFHKCIDSIDLKKELTEFAQKKRDEYLYGDAFIYADTKPQRPSANNQALDNNVICGYYMHRRL